MNDKLILNLEDNTKLAEYFSRKEAGEQCEFRIKASLDEGTDKQATLSVDEIVIVGGATPEGEPVDNADEQTTEEGVMEWAKNRSKSNDEAVPATYP